MAISAALTRPAMHPWPMTPIPDPEVPERPTRRSFSATCKVAILDEVDRSTAPGSKGAIIRREGLVQQPHHRVGEAPGPRSAWSTPRR